MPPPLSASRAIVRIAEAAVMKMPLSCAFGAQLWSEVILSLLFVRTAAMSQS
jgi:hypothetical protein